MRGKYDSKFEKVVDKILPNSFKFHPCTVAYIEYSNYEPDWVFKAGGKTYYIEGKGRFRTRSEAKKYTSIQQTLERNNEENKAKGKATETEELIFLFQDCKKPMPGARRRKKCGTKQTMREWADKNGFRWFCHKCGLPEDIEREITRS